MSATTSDQDRAIQELMVRHVQARVDPVEDTSDVFVYGDGDAAYLLAADGQWGRIDLVCGACCGAGYRPQFPGLHIWCACVKRDDDSGEWA